MSLNKVQLPGFVVADLYADSLVLTENEAGIKKPLKNNASDLPVDENRKFLGDNLKNILVVVKNPGLPFLPDEDLKFLTGVLAACKLSLADVAIINMESFPLSTYKELVSLYKSKIALLFDISPVDFGLPLNFPYYQIQPFAGCSFLYAPSLKSIENDKGEKSKLWVSLKRLFNI